MSTTRLKQMRSKPKRFHCPAIHGNHGFTMIEMLVVSVLIVIVSTALFSAFKIGINTFQVVQKDRKQDLAMQFVKEKINRDFFLSHTSMVIPFVGERNEVAFPTLIRSSEGGLPRLGRVIYKLDGRDQLMRIEETYSDVTQEKDGKRKSMILEGVDHFRIKYYTYSDIGEDYSWESSWDMSNEETEEERKRFPAGIRLEFTFDEKGKKVPYEITHYFPFARPIPIDLLNEQMTPTGPEVLA